jgi:hypothetical protein
MKIHGVNVGGPGRIHGVPIDRLASRRIHGVDTGPNLPRAIHGQVIDPSPQRLIHGGEVSDPRTDAEERLRRQAAGGFLEYLRKKERKGNAGAALVVAYIDSDGAVGNALAVESATALLMEKWVKKQARRARKGK